MKLIFSFGSASLIRWTNSKSLSLWNSRAWRRSFFKDSKVEFGSEFPEWSLLYIRYCTASDIIQYFFMQGLETIKLLKNERKSIDNSISEFGIRNRYSLNIHSEEFLSDPFKSLLTLKKLQSWSVLFWWKSIFDIFSFQFSNILFPKS